MASRCATRRIPGEVQLAAVTYSGPEAPSFGLSRLCFSRAIEVGDLVAGQLKGRRQDQGAPGFLTLRHNRCSPGAVVCDPASSSRRRTEFVDGEEGFVRAKPGEDGANAIEFLGVVRGRSTLVPFEPCASGSRLFGVLADHVGRRVVLFLGVPATGRT